MFDRLALEALQKIRKKNKSKESKMIKFGKKKKVFQHVQISKKFTSGFFEYVLSGQMYPLQEK